MTNKQENKLAMYKATLSVMTQNQASWSSITAVAAAVTALDQKINQLVSTSALQDLQLTGIAQDKRSIRESLNQSAFEIASILFAYAESIADAELREKVNYSITEIRRATDAAILQRSINFHALAAAHTSSLTPFGMTQQKLTQLNNLVSAFSAKSAAPRTAASNKAAITKTIKDLLRGTDDHLKKTLDKLMVNFKVTNTEFYNAYSIARTIVDLGKSSHYIVFTIGPNSQVIIDHTLDGSTIYNVDETALIVYGDHSSNEDGVELLPGDSMLLRVSNPSITVTNTHSTMAGKIKVRITSTQPATITRQAKTITVTIPAGSTKTIHDIIRGSQVQNLGPAQLTLCDCSEPDCGITDDDQPCGYEQTIDEMAFGSLDTTQNYIHATNKDTKKPAKLKISVYEKISSNGNPASAI